MKCSWCSIPEKERKYPCLEKTILDIKRLELSKSKAKEYETSSYFIKNKRER